MQNFQSVTFKAETILREIITDIGISLPNNTQDVQINPFIKDDPRIFQTKALWDTGATGCAVTKKTATDLKLQPIGLANVTHVNGTTQANVYLIDIFLPNLVIVPAVRVTECDDGVGNFGVIIGMEVITSGDFAITNVGNKTTVSFRIPSIQTIDYNVEAQRLKDLKFKGERNKSCPCGSGKKYKNCHGKTNN